MSSFASSAAAVAVEYHSELHLMMPKETATGIAFEIVHPMCWCVITCKSNYKRRKNFAKQYPQGASGFVKFSVPRLKRGGGERIYSGVYVL